MDKEQKNGVSLKLLVDKKKNTVVFAESESDFVDILFSFLTIPMGKVVSLFPEMTLGCFKNLYESVEKIDVSNFHFQNNACKSMLLHPRNATEDHCSGLKLKIDDSDPTIFFRCSDYGCRNSTLRSRYSNVLCQYNCHSPMNHLTHTPLVDRDMSVFVKGGNRFIITDDLRVTLTSTVALCSLFSKHRITSKSELEERDLTLDTNQVKVMLIYSLKSRNVLTDTFLKNELDLKPRNVVSFLKLSSAELGSQEQPVEAMRVKLIISKSKRTVCFAEVSRDFVNLLFSFLTVPIGHIGKQIHGESCLNMCIDHLYKTVLDLDEHCFKTTSDKQMLLSPTLSHGFRYRNDLLGIKESGEKFYCTANDGFLTGPTMFIVSDCLKITPISASVCFSILDDLNVCSDDIVEHVVHVGKNEALLLLVNSFLTENALTDTFFKKPKQEK